MFFEIKFNLARKWTTTGSNTLLHENWSGNIGNGNNVTEYCLATCKSFPQFGYTKTCIADIPGKSGISLISIMLITNANQFVRITAANCGDASSIISITYDITTVLLVLHYY